LGTLKYLDFSHNFFVDFSPSLVVRSAIMTGHRQALSSLSRVEIFYFPSEEDF